MAKNFVLIVQQSMTDLIFKQSTSYLITYLKSLTNITLCQGLLKVNQKTSFYSTSAKAAAPSSPVRILTTLSRL
ncbi:hypothetical protein SAMN05216249_11648 [Acetitomaculum ruminis DSM 5522]|uniref:Uncharacterized protein n=1 Tax=Acetitomaculum ruminis DSM 5522 TaxID=1120918 RepID=A0A1I0ZPK1_9FIRM|nr:hypothetical protein SAMN05216249_11648 [Acetitomaculum ruminis DSM 5522]